MQIISIKYHRGPFWVGKMLSLHPSLSLKLTVNKAPSNEQNIRERDDGIIEACAYQKNNPYTRPIHKVDLYKIWKRVHDLLLMMWNLKELMTAYTMKLANEDPDHMPIRE